MLGPQIHIVALVFSLCFACSLGQKMQKIESFYSKLELHNSYLAILLNLVNLVRRGEDTSSSCSRKEKEKKRVIKKMRQEKETGIPEPEENRLFSRCPSPVPTYSSASPRADLHSPVTPGAEAAFQKDTLAVATNKSESHVYLCICGALPCVCLACHPLSP